MRHENKIYNTVYVISNVFFNLFVSEQWRLGSNKKGENAQELLWPSGMHNVERSAIHYMVWKVAGRVPES